MLSSGRTIQLRVELDADLVVGMSVPVPSGEARTARNAAPAIPNNLRASLRLRIFPTGWSSFSIKNSFYLNILYITQSSVGRYQKLEEQANRAQFCNIFL